MHFYEQYLLDATVGNPYFQSNLLHLIQQLHDNVTTVLNTATNKILRVEK